MTQEFPNASFLQVRNPTDTQVDAAVDLFVDLMTDDSACRSLAGGNITLIGPMGRSILRAGILSGEYFEAQDKDGSLLGFLVCMPEGEDLFSTEEQRAQGFMDFASRLSPEGKEYYKSTYLIEFPEFVNSCLGPTGKRDSWYINMLMVRREHHGQGIGTTLVDLVREKVIYAKMLFPWVRKKGGIIALSTTTAINAEIYQRMGFNLLADKIMPSPWGEWVLYILSIKEEEQREHPSEYAQ